MLKPSHPHMFTYSHIHKLTPSHLLTFTHTHIFTSFDLHILTSAPFTHLLSLSLSFSLALHLHIFTSSYLHILTSSHLLIFTSSHLHILTSSHSVSLSLSPLSLSLSLLSLSLSLYLSLSLSLFSLKAAGSANEAPQYGHPFARNEVRVSKLGMFCNLTSSAATLSQEMRFERLKAEVFLRLYNFGGNPWSLSVKNWCVFSILPLRWQPLLRANAEDVTSQKTISFLTTEPHFVRKGCRQINQTRKTPSLFDFWRSNLVSCERVAVEDVKSQKKSVFDTRTSFRAKRLPRRMQNRKKNISFWHSNFISRERVATEVVKSQKTHQLLTLERSVKSGWFFLRFYNFGSNPFVRNEVRVSKTDCFLRLWLVRS